MKSILSFIAFIIIITLQHYLFNSVGAEKTEVSVPEDSVLTVTLCFTGDLMCHSTQFNYANVGADTFDFTGVYTEVKTFLSESDFTVGNLETVVAGKNKGYSGYPYFNAPDDFIYALKDAGFDLLITANNHALDQGWDGVKRTIEIINDNQLYQTGTFVSKEDRDSVRIFEINSITIAFLAYSENTNGLPIPKGKDFAINLIDEELMKNDIVKAREKNVDVVLVHLHFGQEYLREPDDYQKQIVNKIIEYGADIIIGGHPHVIQPVNFFKTNNAKLDSGFVAYSLGNFVSNQRWRYSDAGLILNIQISKNILSDSIYIREVNYLPTWVFKGETEKGREYVILPSQLSNDTTCNYLTKHDKKLMEEAFSDTKEIINKYSNNSKIKLLK
ncbi:MAG: CapA family protein [Ignavibacteriota bacterium]|nr:MAG: CapA family protein [Chlorobiota bacterium]MBE7477888.1 CapA family protein [Ignavibacteriales bacterium]MBL1124414.1 CapA family protein [Ignavibacteriota bacterium]MCC7094319.1 CapA family protein [Ignavibacteriaceae bacterium]MCE7857333.1 CapA family protein [Ignavibacteria bacterium CHB3]MEB2296023.1 CapA family protein [Ignavibacteria bacterium]